MRLESEGQIRRSEALVFEEALKTDASRFDGIFLDCVLDPALEQLQETFEIPAFGITNLVSNFLGSLGLRMSAVARNESIAHELAQRMDAFGWSHQTDGVVVLDLSLEDISDPDLWNRTIREHMGSGGLQSVDVVINGCSAVEVRPAGGPRIIDPTTLALKLIGIGAELLLPEEA
jgi:Asp/Glu/hydantoin racemase